MSSAGQGWSPWLSPPGAREPRASHTRQQSFGSAAATLGTPGFNHLLVSLGRENRVQFLSLWNLEDNNKELRNPVVYPQTVSMWMRLDTHSK